MTRLVVFDCDGTLVDSQYVIARAMADAFVRHGRAPRPIEDVRQVVGLSLDDAIAVLAPDALAEERLALAASYKEAFHALRRLPGGQEPLFAGVAEVLAELDRRGHILAIATGKGRRGVTAVLEHHRLSHLFASVQTADEHPGKPHPSMLEGAMRETGSRPEETVLVGDTAFDVAMARAAHVEPIGVAWGYHPPEALRRSGALRIIERCSDLLDLVSEP